MRKITISVTDAARNFFDCVSRARYQNVIFVLLKKRIAGCSFGARQRKNLYGRSLAEALAQIELPDDEARIWRHDLQTVRKRLKLPIGKWR